MSQYPTALDDDSTLFVPVDAFSTKPQAAQLAVLCLSTDTDLQLTVTPGSVGFPAAYCILSLEDELITYSSVGGSGGKHLLGCTRGAFGTTAVGHAGGTAIQALVSVQYLLALKAAIEAVQSTVGIGGAYNFLTSPPTLVKGQPLSWNDSNDSLMAEDTPAWLSGFPNVLTVQMYDGAIAFRNSHSGAVKMVFDLVNDRVGIGTTTPAEALDVAGNVNVSGDYYKGGVLFTGGGGAAVLFTFQSAQHTVTGAPVDFYDVVIPANTLSNDGDKLYIEATVYCQGASTTNPQLTLLLAGQALSITAAPGTGNVLSTTPALLRIALTLTRTSVSGIRTAGYSTLCLFESGGFSSSNHYFFTEFGSDSSGLWDFTTDQHLVVRAESAGSGQAASDVQSYGGYVEFKPVGTAV